MERMGEAAQDFVAVGGEEEHPLEPHATDLRVVGPRLDHQHHSLLKCDVLIRHDAWPFVDASADAVPGMERVVHAGMLEHRAHCTIEVRGGYAAPERLLDDLDGQLRR